jgi:Zn-dependent protease/CBS domain-containing protein
MNSSSFKVMRIGGIDIYVHWSWLLALAIFTWSIGDLYHTDFKSWTLGVAYLLGFISAMLLFATVLIHELAHSFTARANRLPVHTITLFIFGGVSNLTREPQTPRIELLVAIAGPLASLILAGIFFGLHAVLGGSVSYVRAVVGYLAVVNLLLAVFNLIPGFPLDGGRVLRALLWMGTHNLRRATHLASNVGQAIGYLFITGGVLLAVIAGDLGSGIWLAFIGWFLQNAASATWRQAVVDQVLAGVDVHDVMDPAPPSVGPAVTVAELVYGHMLQANQRAIPVSGLDGSLAGLVTLNDVNRVTQEEWTRTAVSRVMTPAEKLVSVRPRDHLKAALALLAENNFNQLPVIEGGRLVGMLNRSHVLQYLHMRQQISEGRGAPPGRPLAS